MKKKKIQLPKKFVDEAWVRCGSRPEWEQYIDLPCISYSQLTSFTDYRTDYIKGYLFGIREDAGIFARYGSAVGVAIETSGGTLDKEWLTEDTCDHLAKFYYPQGESYQFERPILIPIDVDGETVILYGFIDVYGLGIPEVDIIDIKTGSIEKKKDFYGGKEYMQTKLYAYAEDLMGNEVGYCGVLLLDRKGNSAPSSGGRHPLRLTGESLSIPTPYVREEVEAYIADKVIPLIKDMSSFYKSKVKIFGEIK